MTGGGSSEAEPPRFASERDERFVHRLEGFSDIVIAFALGQMSLNLVLPHRVGDLYGNPVWLLAFLLTFIITANIWHAHHQIFERFFEPTPLQIVLNFAVLAATLLLAYMLQVYVHFTVSASNDALAVVGGYLAAFAVTWLLLGTLAAVGLRQRWSELDAGERRYGIERSVRNIAIGAATLIGLGATVTWDLSVYVAMWCIPIGAIASRLALRRILPRVGPAEEARADLAI